MLTRAPAAIFLLLLAAACGGSSAPDPESDVAELPSPAELRDRSSGVATRQSLAAFLLDYAQRTIVSMAAAELAMDRAQQPPVRELAERIRVDHRELYNAAYRLGQDLQLRLPAETTDEKYTEVIRLSAYADRDFDRAYLDVVIEYHEWLEVELEPFLTYEEVPAVMTLAQRVRSRSQQHLDSTRRVSRTLLLDRAGPKPN